MRVGHLFGETLRKPPADADIRSHQLLLRAGYIRPAGNGIFSYLPLGWRTLQNMVRLIREELADIGGQELLMPVVNPAEIWQKSGVWEVLADSRARFRDQRDRELLLAPTHEPLLTHLAQAEIRSYRQLPQMLFQFQSRYRDEARVYGGLLRTREIFLLDAYSLDRDRSGLQRQYADHFNAYFRIAARLGLPLQAVESDRAFFGGELAHELVYYSDAGEETVARCGECGYAANREVAQFELPVYSREPANILEKVATPGASSIETLSQFLGIKKQQTAKIVFYSAEFGGDRPSKLLICVVRGDLEANPVAVRRLSGALQLRPALPEEIEAVGCIPGFASPIGIERENVLVLVDELITRETNLVTGANQIDFHYCNSNCPRDYQPDITGPLALAPPGAACRECRHPLEYVPAVEVGNLHDLNRYYSRIFEATYLDEKGVAQPFFMGSYGLGLGRLLACLAEEHHDEYGLCWPVSVAPYPVALVLLKGEQTVETAEKLYRDLQEAGIEVLYDDRDVGAGVKFNDADLRGLPLRITVSGRSLEQGGVELKLRREKDRTIVPLDAIVDTVREALAAQEKVLDDRLRQVPQ